MKKEYIILGLIIIALSAYLVTNKTDRDNYTLPSIAEINAADIAEIAIERDNDGKDSNGNYSKNIIISKKDGAWLVSSSDSDKTYPADKESITKIVDVVKALKLSALVSESGNFAPYELDTKNRINITVKSKTETVRKFEIGKTAPSFRHTFIRLDGSNNVYHAENSFRGDFDKTVGDLRDKKVLVFDKTKINTITLKKGDGLKEAQIKDGKVVADAKDGKSLDKSSDKNIGDKDAKSNNASVENGSVKSLDSKSNDAIESILTTLSDMKCHSFTNTDSKDEFKDKGVEQMAKITLKQDSDKKFSLVIYKKNEKGNYPAISSESIYPFYLNTYEGDEIVSKIDDAIGLNQKTVEAKEQ